MSTDIRAPRMLSAPRAQDAMTMAAAQMHTMTPDEEYASEIVNALSTSDVVVSLVCYGAQVTELHKDAVVDEGKIGRGLVRSYLTTAYNAAADAFGDKVKALEHCIMRTVGQGLVLDYTGCVWPSDTVGVYICFLVSAENRNNILDTTNQILSETESPSAAVKAFLDLLLLPLAHNWDGDELTMEVMVYVRFVFTTIALQVSPAELVTIQNALSKITEVDTRYSCCLLGLLSVEFGLDVPTYVPDECVTRKYLEILSQPAWNGPEDERNLRVLKFWIEAVGENKSSALWASMYLDLHLERDVWPDDLNNFADRLSTGTGDWIDSIDIYRLVHRANTDELVLGVGSIAESMEVIGGYIDPADHGEITVEALEGRCIGKVAGNRRASVYLDDNNEVVVVFKDARNYFLNVLHFLRPRNFVQTHTREEVIDRNKLTGLPAIHLLLRGVLSENLARFVVALLTYGAIKLKKKDGYLVSDLFGSSDGSYEYDAGLSPSILAAMPVLIARGADGTIRKYLYNDGKTYRLRLYGASWFIYLEEPRGTLECFGKLSTAYPLARKRSS